MDEQQGHDQEITQDYQLAGDPPGHTKLLITFFVIAVLCAVFFAVGYKMGFGSSSSSQTAGTQQAAPAAASNIPKPSAAHSSDGNTGSTSTKPEDDLTFYKSVEKKPEAKLAPATPAAANNPAKPLKAPELAHGSGIVVQVAAVTKEEDADALVEALRKKNYPVFMVGNQAGDKFFHVQVGPFANLNDAESMRARLSGDGYNAIVKK
jgi:DedD protein